MESVLIIDDDVALCRMLADYFALHQVQLAMCHHGLTGLERARTGTFDMVLLDIMLPGINGFEVLSRLRAVSQVSVLLLTSRGEAEDRIVGLEAGADDYLPKPFNPRELLARIRAVLRRRDRNIGPAAPPASSRLANGGFVLDVAARTVSYQDSPLALTDIEFALLQALLESPGIVLSREMLVERVFHRGFNPLDRSLDMLVSRLRRKLDLADNPGALIKTIRSSGYNLVIPEQP
jgi:DNA-binding response OmpR family regulator